MPSDPSGYHSLLLPNGLLVERLPLGFAAGHWWLPAVLSGEGNWLRARNSQRPDYAELIHLEGPDGPVDATSHAGGGDNSHHAGGDVLHAVWEFGLIPWVELHYQHNGVEIDHERLELASPAEL